MQTDDRLKFKFLVFISCFILCSCTRIYNHSEKDPIPKKEPIKDRVYFTYGLKSKEAEESGGIYIVKKGDSLYTISLLYDVNYKSIAKWNNIKKPYKITPGQKIVIKSKQFRKQKVSKNKSINFHQISNGCVLITEKYQKEFSYSDIGKKGIDITGDIGDDIYSAFQKV